MWPDNETEVDLLGFRVHSDLVEEIVTDGSLLPITVGVFGDWGSGKSSVMKMLESSLGKRDDIACIYFNGWQFEGYDEAKSALIRSILLELREHRLLSAEVKQKITNFLKRIDWLRLAKTGYQTLVAPVIAGYLAGLTGSGSTLQVGATMPALTLSGQSQPDASDQQGIFLPDLHDVVRKDVLDEGFMGVRQLRDDFKTLIADTKLKSIVILIDDLDRCEPSRLLDTLEAIKLFLAVPRVAFVIGADERIVRYAIATRYETVTSGKLLEPGVDQANLVTDYLEKLIQVPYHLPRLSSSEVETYISLLLCQQQLGGDFDCVHRAFLATRSSDLTSSFAGPDIAEALKEQGVVMPSRLGAELSWCRMAALSLSDLLKGNPRQTKRLLNALMLRRKLAGVASIELDESVLVKLMILEYTKPSLFAELYRWQAIQSGAPSELRTLEAIVKGDGQAQEDIGQYPDWLLPDVRRWLDMPPSLTNVDLRSYFWITRDRLTGILSGAAAIPRYLRDLLAYILQADGILVSEMVEQFRRLDTSDKSLVYQELTNSLKRSPDGGAVRTWIRLADAVPEAGCPLIRSLTEMSYGSIPGATPSQLVELMLAHNELERDVTELLVKWSTATGLPIGRGAQEALESLRDRK